MATILGKVLTHPRFSEIEKLSFIKEWTDENKRWASTTFQITDLEELGKVISVLPSIIREMRKLDFFGSRLLEIDNPSQYLQFFPWAKPNIILKRFWNCSTILLNLNKKKFIGFMERNHITPLPELPINYNKQFPLPRIAFEITNLYKSAVKSDNFKNLELLLGNIPEYIFEVVFGFPRNAINNNGIYVFYYLPGKLNNRRLCHEIETNQSILNKNNLFFSNRQQSLVLNLISAKKKQLEYELILNGNVLCQVLIEISGENVFGQSKL
jgi:hypothetical protein